ncbi:MAG TPA: transketolase C-terminal domain-containing protein [Candidatus Paceibacterota bacterium]|nr:transketolase C-terminal domain-containing protein [Candidatus Paceibacterota bacterium]
MLSKDAKLVENIFDAKIAQAATRDGFGKGVVEAGKADANVVVLCADLKESTRAEEFEEAFPDRFIEMGVAEQGMATVAAGFAEAGKIPFIASYAAFSPGRNYEQIRTTIALNEMPVKIMGMHAGVSVGPDGATHQMLEDLALMRVLPGMLVLNPGDSEEARKAVLAAAKTNGPAYIRFGRSATPVFTTAETPFELGKALPLWKSANPKVALLATGQMSYNALMAARALDADGIGTLVLHNPSVKPLDEAAILAAAEECGRIVTIEEHQIAGGFGSAVAELLSENYPVPVKRLGIDDQFGQSGEPPELLEHYKLSPAAIAHACERGLKS